MAIQWRIYWNDDTTSDNSQVEPGQVGRTIRLVVCIICQDRETNRCILDKRDWYVYRTDYATWMPMDTDGMKAAVKYEIEHVGAVLQGGLVSDSEFKAIKQRAQADPDFLPHSAGVHYKERYGKI